ncbi:MAG: glycosyltransferase family 4 protein [Planctomycetota bacterium]
MTALERHVQTIGLLCSYVPRKCGIATFSKDLRDACVTARSGVQTLVLAMDDTPEGYDYPTEVRFQLQSHKPGDYQLAAELLNINQTDLVLVQHEYGIFGGPAGEHVLNLLRRLRMPIITTLHTVLRDPSAEQVVVLREILRLSARVVVMCEAARAILRDGFGVSDEQVKVIPHGIPDVPFVDPAFFKDQFGLEGRSVLMTFGLLSPGKGIEVAIKALPEIVRAHPEVIYVVVGATHPHVLKHEGNAYLVSLQRLAKKLKVQDHVLFHNRYVELEELCRYLGAADIYVVPYPGRTQITSGTLAYAMGMGKPVVSTPFVYAEEMLAGDCGQLFAFDDATALAREVNGLIEDPGLRNSMRKRAYMATRNMIWPEVGRAYLKLADDVLQERSRCPRPVPSLLSHGEFEGLPEPNITHLRTLTDNTGIIQHAIYSVPDRAHGYATDDNARAAITAVYYYDLFKDDTVLPLLQTYLAYLHHAFDRTTKRFRNILTYDRQWSETSEQSSSDAHGRALWALGVVTARAPNPSLLTFATRLFIEGLERVDGLNSPRTWAFILVGIHAYLQRYAGDALVRRVRIALVQRLHAAYRGNATAAWPWWEDTVTYANAKLPHALIIAGHGLADPAMLADGLHALEWLVGLQLGSDGMVSLIGNQGWLRRDGSRATFDQQPIEAMALIEACAEAFRCTGDPAWKERANQFLGWFLGNNDTHSMLYDFATGGCRDGLHSDGANLNEGAESTLAWLIALLTVHGLEFEAAQLAAVPPVA